MYHTQNRIKVFIVLFLDLLIITLSVFWADYLKHGGRFLSADNTDATFLITIFISTHLASNLIRNQYTQFFNRGFFKELIVVVIDNVLMLGVATIFLYFMKISTNFSRTVVSLFFIIDTILMWLVHVIWKKLVPIIYEQAVDRRKLLIIGEKDLISMMLTDLKVNKDLQYEVVGLVVLDQKDVKEIEGNKVVADKAGIIKYVRTSPVDEVFILAEDSFKKLLIDVINDLGEMGVTIHYQIPVLDLSFSRKRMLSQFGRFYMITYANQVVSFGHMQLKRMMDILGAIIGCVFLLIITIIFGPLIKLESPGPIFFKQKRVGTNGRVFNIIKFRSMYIDAEERKAELLRNNEMSGFMFKMENDPRITKVGKFMRKTSLDEFPQFLNVLKGDMSLVGTRPPTLDEYKKYDLHHKRRLSSKPGITGMWQANGRNDISDFEDVVRMDVDYIDNWSLMLDIKIIMKTVLALFNGK